MTLFRIITSAEREIVSHTIFSDKKKRKKAIFSGLAAGIALFSATSIQQLGIYTTGSAGVTGLMFYENIQSFNVSAGAEPGAPVNISPSYPAVPWMEFRYDCETGKAGTGDQLYMYTSDLAPVAEIRGTYGLERGKKRLDCSNKFPEYTCAVYFKR